MLNKNQITYLKVGYYNIPNIILSPEEKDIKIGKWGVMHKDYLIKNKKILFTECKLWQYLADVDT